MSPEPRVTSRTGRLSAILVATVAALLSGCGAEETSGPSDGLDVVNVPSDAPTLAAALAAVAHQRLRGRARKGA